MHRFAAADPFVLCLTPPAAPCQCRQSAGTDVANISSNPALGCFYPDEQGHGPETRRWVCVCAPEEVRHHEEEP